ncbi:MAG: polysaccharide biosynthesis tyrosine autokinase [Syntrophales bacterium]
MGKMFKALEKAEKERLLDIQKEYAAPKLEPIEAFLNAPSIERKLVSYFQPGSMVGEQFKKLRTNMFNHSSPGSFRTILVTSAREAEGKTIVAANLAAAIAQDLNAHALLVEADLRNPSLASWFGMQNGKGLSDYLTQTEDLVGLFMKTPIAKLTLLSGGRIPENPVELIGSKKMEILIHELKARYADRYIIIDSSPLLATTEPNVLTKMVDGILLVIRAGETPREAVAQAMGYLLKEKVIGVVLNHLEFKSSALRSRYFGSKTYYDKYAERNGEPGFWRRMKSRFTFADE